MDVFRKDLEFAPFELRVVFDEPEELMTLYTFLCLHEPHGNPQCSICWLKLVVGAAPLVVAGETARMFLEDAVGA